MKLNYLHIIIQVVANYINQTQKNVKTQLETITTTEVARDFYKIKFNINIIKTWNFTKELQGRRGWYYLYMMDLPYLPSTGVLASNGRLSKSTVSAIESQTEVRSWRY
jgi:hypothetical protein